MKVQIPNYQIHKTIDVGVLTNENVSYIEMGMKAAKLGYDKHIVPFQSSYEFITGLYSCYLFFKREQLNSMEFSDEEIDDEMGFRYCFGHDLDDYYFDPFTGDPEMWAEDEYYMVRKSSDEIYWFDRNGKVYLLKFHIIE